MAGRAAAGGARDHRRSQDRDRFDGGDRDASPCSPAAGGLGSEIVAGSNITFKTGVVDRQRAADRDGDRLRRLAAARPAQADRAGDRRAGAGGPRRQTPRRPRPGRVPDAELATAARLPRLVLGGAIDFIFSQRESSGGGTAGGWPRPEVGELTWHPSQGQLHSRSRVPLALALPIGTLARPPRHRRAVRGRDRQCRPGDSRARADRPAWSPSSAPGRLNVAIALAVLGIPPILTNTFVGVHQVDREAVEAARGMGMSEPRGRRRGRAAARRADDHDRRAHGARSTSSPPPRSPRWPVC